MAFEKVYEIQHLHHFEIQNRMSEATTYERKRWCNGHGYHTQQTQKTTSFFSHYVDGP